MHIRTCNEGRNEGYFETPAEYVNPYAKYLEVPNVEIVDNSLTFSQVLKGIWNVIKFISGLVFVALCTGSFGFWGFFISLMMIGAMSGSEDKK